MRRLLSIPYNGEHTVYYITALLHWKCTRNTLSQDFDEIFHSQFVSQFVGENSNFPEAITYFEKCVQQVALLFLE